MSSANHQTLEIDTGTGFEDGLNFHSHHHFNPEYVAEALNRLRYERGLGDTHCFHLALHCPTDRDAHFRPSAVITDDVAVDLDVLPSEVPLRYLLPNEWDWPLLTVSDASLELEQDGDRLPTRTRQFLESVKWYAQARVQVGQEFVGLFIVFGTADGPRPDNRDIQTAYFATKTYIESLIEYALKKRTLTLEFKHRVNVCVQSIERTKCHNSVLALRHVADALTAHLGVTWNRAAFYGPVSGGAMECLWAQGGDGSDHWTEVQKTTSHRYKSFEQMAGDHSQRLSDDPYYLSAAFENPVRITDISDPENECILAQLWQEDGEVGALPTGVQEWHCCDVPTMNVKSIDRSAFNAVGPLAAVIRQNDPWIQAVVDSRPGEPIFVSLNGTYWILPWLAEAHLLGFWVVDMAYWGDLGPSCAGAPSRVFSRAILDSLAHCFSAGKNWR